MTPKEDPKVSRIRRQVDRLYGCKIYDRDFNLAMRFPIKSVKYLDDEHIELARESLEITGVEEIKEKTVTVYLIGDKDYLEMEVDTFIEAVEEGVAKPIHDTVISKESQKQSMIDRRVRKLIDEASKKVSKKVVKGGGSGQGKVKESYTLGGRGRVVGYRPARKDTSFGDIALVPSIRRAIQTGSFDDITGVRIKSHHLQEKIYRSRTRTHICLVVDRSFYADSRKEINTVQMLIRTILTIAYEKRYHVGIVSYSGNSATVDLPFTTDVDKGYEVIKRFEWGGLSPLASGMKAGLEMLEKVRGDRTDMILMMVLITRGKANVPLYPGGFVRRELMDLAKMISRSHVRSMIYSITDDDEHLIKEISLRSDARYYKPPLLSDRVSAASGFLETLSKGESGDVVESGKRFLKELDLEHT